MLFTWFYMEQTWREDIFLITALLVFLLAVTVISLFVVFQRRKNFLLEKQEQQRKQFEREITETQIEIREETLRNISWELHDNIGQLLTLAKIQLQHLTEENKDEVTETIGKSLNELRALSKLINPEFIKNIELRDALQLEIDRFNRLNYIEATLTKSGEEKRVAEKPGMIIFRMLQEFFSNTLKHARATTLDVVINYFEDKIEITSTDNGIGFDTESIAEKGIGLKNIKKRGELINANVKLTSVPQKGTTLKIIYYI